VTAAGAQTLREYGGRAPVAAPVRRVLIVEDDQRMASVLSRALGQCQFEVECAADGAAALEAVRSKQHDLIVLDLLLPELDGFSVLDRLQESDAARVLVLSALADVESKVKCFDLGVCDYVTKPFSLDEVVARVRIRIRELEGGGTGRYLEDGRRSLDLQRRAVLADGKRVNLSSREFLLLEYLMRREGDVCARAELLAAVWGYSFDPGTNVVDVYVRRLRNKLGGDVIETIRSRGYSYVG
jgi:two-component system, OmpR family, response regulator